MYEYTVVPRCHVYPSDIQNQINDHAKNRWRLVSVNKGLLYFERKIQKPKKRIRNV